MKKSDRKLVNKLDGRLARANKNIAAVVPYVEAVKGESSGNPRLELLTGALDRTIRKARRQVGEAIDICEDLYQSARLGD